MNPEQEPNPPSQPARWRKAAVDLIQPVPYEPIAANREEARNEQINYLRLLWHYKLSIIAAVLAGITIGLAVVVLQVPVYRSNATVEVVGFNEAFMGMSQYDPQAGTGSYTNIQTQIQILSSPTLLSTVVDRVTLESTPISPVAADLFGKARNSLGVVAQEPVDFQRLSIRTASETFVARARGSSRLIDITADSPSPEVAAAFVNALAQEYITQNAHFRTSSAARTTQWLEGQIEEANSRLNQADEKLQAFVKKEGIAFVLDQSTLADTKLRQLQADLSAIQTDRINKQSRYELAKSSPIDSLPEILDDGTLRGIRDSLTGLRKQRAELRATLTPANVKVQRVDAQIVELEQTMQREKANLVKRIENEYEAAQRRERLLTSAYNGQSATLANQAGKAAEYNQLKREVEVSRQTYSTLLQQYNQTAMVAAVPTSNVRVVDAASPSSKPYKPEPSKDVALATGVTTGFAIALIILLEKIRIKKLGRVFTMPGLMSGELNLPELGVIPAFQRPVRRYVLNGFSVRRQTPVNGTAQSSGSSRELIVLNAPNYVADSFRHTLTSLMPKDSSQSQSLIIVTSAGPGEGKTALTGNLAAATAETGRRVLLVDADLRRARLHEIFNLKPEQGFADLLQSETPVSETKLTDFIQQTSVPGVSLLSCGNAKTISVGAMMFSMRLPALFARLREEFDLVLVDTAPALQFSDARLLARLSDGVILIVRSGVTFRESAVAVAQRFAEDGVSVLGTILNDWDPQKSTPNGRYANHYKSAYEYYHRKD